MRNLLNEIDLQGLTNDNASTFPPPNDDLDRFFIKVQNAQDSIVQMKEIIKNTKMLHDKILSSPVEDIDSKNKLNSEMDNFKRNAKMVKNAIDQIIVEVKEDSNKVHLKTAEIQIKNNQKYSLTKDLNSIMTEYSTVQNIYRENMTRRIERQAAVAGKSMTYDEIEQIIESGGMHTFIDQVAATEKAKEMLVDIEQRHNDIRNLEMKLQDVYQMFQDLSIIIMEQGTLIDRIDHNVDQALDYIETGETQLVKAADYKKSSIKTKIAIGVVIAIIIIIIIAVAVTQSKK